MPPSQVEPERFWREELATLNPDLVVQDKEAKAYSVCYQQVNAMLLNEFLKEHRAFLGRAGKGGQIGETTCRA